MKYLKLFNESIFRSKKIQIPHITIDDVKRANDALIKKSVDKKNITQDLKDICIELQDIGYVIKVIQSREPYWDYNNQKWIGAGVDNGKIVKSRGGEKLVFKVMIRRANGEYANLDDCSEVILRMQDFMDSYGYKSAKSVENKNNCKEITIPFHLNYKCNNVYVLFLEKD